MRFSLLGPLVVTDDEGELVTPTGSRLQVLLAALLLHPNTLVPTGTLAEMVWDGAPPAAAADTLRSYVRRLRQALGPDAHRITAQRSGYLINVRSDELDTLEFESLGRATSAALQAGEWAGAFTAATQALGLWQASPLSDVSAEMLRAEFAPRFERLRLQLIESRFDAGFQLGRYRELIPELQEMTAQQPLQERFHAQLMIALASIGRRAQSLEVYRKARQVLIRDLGIEPGPHLRGIHQQVLVGHLPEWHEQASGIPLSRTTGQAEASAPAILSRAPSRDAPSRWAHAAATLPRPAQLPADIADFTGREVQVRYIRDALTCREPTESPGTVPVVVVAGTAGLGKSALAVHAAHQLQDLFPDGQLYANLSGASAAPAKPEEVLARFLRDLGVDGDVPPSEEERGVLYRTFLNGRRMLILLDDAKDTPQVRPLLPGSSSCAVIVTTRNRTPYLVSSGFVDLTTLPEPEALELFSRIVGYDRVAAEPEATAQTVAACSGLPLAIRICATRLATRSRWRIAALASRLQDKRRLFDELQVGDLAVRASFRVSFDSLDEGQQQIRPAHAFRLLGLWQGRRISLPAATALIGGPGTDVASALELLVNTNLLEAPTPDHYQFHDLLRLFAAEEAQAEETEEQRQGATTRLLHWYLTTAVAAANVVSPHRYHLPLDGPQVSSQLANSAETALAWYDGEREGVVAAVRMAAGAEMHDFAWRLATALFPLFNRRANWSDCITAHRIGLDSARAAGHRLGESWALQNLGCALVRIGDVQAIGYLEQALIIRRESGDRAGEGQTLTALADASHRFQGPAVAVGHSLRALDVLRRAENPALLAVALNNHGEFCLDLGKLDEAANCFQEVAEACGAYERGHALTNLGRIHLKNGRLGKAIDSLTEAQTLHLASGDLLGQALALQELSQAQRAVGDESGARESLSVALALFEKLNGGTGTEASEGGSSLQLDAMFTERSTRDPSG